MTIYYDNNWGYWDEEWNCFAAYDGYIECIPEEYDSDDAGMIICEVTNEYSKWGNHSDYNDIIESIVFDSSLANLGYPVKIASFLFSGSGLPNLKTIVGMDNLDWSQVTDLQGMFWGCSSLESVDLSFINTKNVTTMAALFSGCSSLKSVDLSSWDTGKVTEMTGLFEGCTSLESVNLCSFDTRNVVDIQNMFKDCTSLKTLDLSNFVVNVGEGKIGVCYNMFVNCTSLETLYMGSFRVGYSDCMRLFNGLTSLKTLDLSNFDTSDVDDMRFMFQDCSKLVSVYVGPGWKVRSFVWAVDMFTGCTSIVGQDGSVYDANCANDYKKAHYGPGGYLKFKGEQLPTDVSPIGAEKTVAFPTDGSLANTTVDDVYYNLTGYDNGYDANEGCIVINESTTMTTGSDGGVRFSEFIGLKFMVNGKGVVDLDCQTYGRKRLYVMVGEGTEPKVYTEDPRGIVEVSYDVTEPTNIYVYAMDEAAASRMVEAKSDCVKLWSLTVKPGATAIAPVTAAEQAAGEYYTLDGRKLTGRPATAGVYVTGGRKVVVK